MRETISHLYPLADRHWGSALPNLSLVTSTFGHHKGQGASVCDEYLKTNIATKQKKQQNVDWQTTHSVRVWIRREWPLKSGFLHTMVCHWWHGCRHALTLSYRQSFKSPDRFTGDSQTNTTKSDYGGG